MPESTLTARFPLDGHTAEFDGITLRETTDTALVSLATSAKGKAALAATLKTALGLDLPEPGKSAANKGYEILPTAAGQWFLRFQAGDDIYPAASIRAKLGDGIAITEQTDNWVQLQISGPRATEALRRICPIDLHPDVFTSGSVARTVMEHLGVLIHRPKANDTYLLMSPSSSARSFLHAIETSAKNIA